jgi:hypothetical protein
MASSRRALQPVLNLAAVGNGYADYRGLRRADLEVLLGERKNDEESSPYRNAQRCRLRCALRPPT